MSMIETKPIPRPAESAGQTEEEKEAKKVRARNDAKVPISFIKSLIKLLNKDSHLVPVEKSAFEDNNTFDSSENPSIAQMNSAYTTKQLQQLWSITLESLKLKTIEVSQLIEECVLEEMIEAFLRSSEEIKQTTFIQILRISTKISQQEKGSKSICKMLFMILRTTDLNTENHNNVTFLLCQGWLDILIYGTFQDLPANKTIMHENVCSVNCKLDVKDSAELLIQASRFLTTCLNLGNFEGVSGAKQHVILKL